MRAHPRHSYVVRREEGDRVWLGGLGVDFKVSADATSGVFSIVEHPVEPKRLIPPHTHTREDELSYVIEGGMGVRIGSEVFFAQAGDYVLKPRDVPHTFWNPGPGMLRILELIWPPAFDTFFRQLALLYEEGGAKPDPDRTTELAMRYGCVFHFDWVPELKTQYGLRLLGE